MLLTVNQPEAELGETWRSESEMAEESPDLSHLTPEERLIIEQVMMRHKQEEQREHEIMR